MPDINSINPTSIRTVDKNEDDYVITNEDVIDEEAMQENDPWQIDTSESKPEETPVEDKEVDPESAEETTESKAWDPNTWNGDMSALPEMVSPRSVAEAVRKIQEKGMHIKFRELAQLRKEAEETRKAYEDKLEQMSKKAQPDEDPMPTLDNTSEDSYNRSIKELIAWNVRQEARKQAEGANKTVMEVLEKQKRLEQEQVHQAWERRCKMIEESDGYTETIGQKMVELAQSHPLWSQAPHTDEGMLELFNHVKRQNMIAAADAAEGKRKATAPARSVERPVGRGKPKKASPSEIYSGSFRDIAEQVASEYGIEL